MKPRDSHREGRSAASPESGSPAVAPDSAADSTHGPTNGRETKPAPDAAAKPRPRRILVVDDHPDAARSLSRMLTLVHGQDVRVAYDGRTALESAESFAPEIVLLDINLPEMDGYEVASRLQQRPMATSCLLVAVSGWSDREARERSRAAGFHLHLVKPIDSATITDLLAGKLRPSG